MPAMISAIRSRLKEYPWRSRWSKGKKEKKDSLSEKFSQFLLTEWPMIVVRALDFLASMSNQLWLPDVIVTL